MKYDNDRYKGLLLGSSASNTLICRRGGLDRR